MKAEDRPVCDDTSACCRELSRVWEALGVDGYTSKSASEHVRELRAALLHAEARPSSPLFEAAFKLVACWQGDKADMEARVSGLREAMQAEARPTQGDTGESLLNPVSQVYFRAGLIACREYMARFVEAESPSIAQSIRSNWWPSLGPDFGPPRQIAFGELTQGDYGTPAFRCKTAEEVSPTLEALPIALGFLESAQEPQR